MRWVLLRGLTREAGHWGSFTARLQARTGAPVLALDLPGTGRCWRERSPASVDGLARDLLRQLPPHDGSTVLLALSLGAMVALQACRLAPDRFAGCVLVNTSAGGASRPWQRLVPWRLPAALRLLAPGLPRLEREQLVLAMTSNAPARHPQAAHDWAELARRHPVSRANALRQLWAAARYRTEACAPPVPLLLLASAQDRLVAPACSRALAQHWHVPLREHPWAGHDLPLDDPHWVLDEVLAWWAQAGRRGAPSPICHRTATGASSALRTLPGIASGGPP